MMKRLLVLLIFIAIGGISHAAIVNGDSVAVNFDNAADAGDFLTVRDDTPSTATLGIAQNAATGTGATPSGGLEAVNVGGTNNANDLAALYAPGGSAAAGAIGFGINETLTMSLKYKVSDNTKAATPRLGIASFSDAATATTNWTVLDIDSGKDMIGDADYADGIAVNVATGGNKTFNIANSINGTGRTLTADPDGPYVLADGAWYQFILDITKSATVDEFDVNATLNLLTADGTAMDSQIASFGQTFTNAGLYADGDVISGFTFVHDGGPATMSNEYDDFAVSVVPEPATMLLLGLGSLVVVRRKK